MQLRVCFENKETVNVNDSAMMKHYCLSYLADFAPAWAGFIMLPHGDTRRGIMEPAWQVVIQDATPQTESDLIAYLRRNPMAAYHVHVYRKEPGREAKVF